MGRDARGNIRVVLKGLHVHKPDVMLDEIVDILVENAMGVRALITRRRVNGGRADGCRRGELQRGKGDR